MQGLMIALAWAVFILVGIWDYRRSRKLHRRDKIFRSLPPQENIQRREKEEVDDWWERIHWPPVISRGEETDSIRS